MVNGRSKKLPAIKSKPTGGKGLKRNLFVVLKYGSGDNDLCVRAGFPLRYNPQFNITIQPCGWYLIEKAASPAISLKVSCINFILYLPLMAIDQIITKHLKCLINQLLQLLKIQGCMNMSSGAANSTALKVKIINLIELAYKSNGDITTSLVKNSGPFTMAIDDQGNAVLSGRTGIVKFSGHDEMQQIGIDLKSASIMFSGSRSGRIHYVAAFNFAGAISVEFSSILDIDKLISSCSGLLCHAYRLIKRDRHKAIDKSLYEALHRSN